MKKIASLILILISLKSFGQSDFKCQARFNMLPIPNFYYASAFKIGMETVNRKWNFGMDFLNYTASHGKRTSYYKDSLLRRTINDQYTYASGFAVNVMRTISFKNNANKLIFGLQGFVGWTNQTTTFSKSTMDTNHFIYQHPSYRNSYDWRGDNQSEITERHGSKLALGVGTFVRIQFEVSKRFTFTPELILPFVFTDLESDPIDLEVDVMPGFNFCIGYRFGKNKPND